MEDTDFSAKFDGFQWTARSEWDKDTPKLNNNIATYGVKPENQEKFDADIELWIKED